MSTGTKLYRRCLVVMSGRSTRGEASRFCGFTDPPMASEGRLAVLTLREALLAEGATLPAIWYVSDRRRAVETFEILTAGMRAPVVRLTDKLREINFGDYENLTWEELPADFQRHYEGCLKAPMDLKFPRGESFRDMCERVSTGALEYLSYEEDNSNIGVIGHQGSMRLWMMMAHGIPPDAFFDDTPELGKGLWLDISVGHVAQWRRKYLSPPQ
jgi:broad specificity phosphatase PhoE